MIDLGLNQFKIKEIKYEVKEGKTVIFKLRNFNLEDVEIVEELKKEKNDAEFENRKTREMIDVAKSSFDFRGMNRRKKEENNVSLKNILDFTLDKTKEIIKKDAKADSEIIKERTEDRIKEDYFKGDPNDEYSSIKSLSDIDGKPIEIKENKATFSDAINEVKTKPIFIEKMQPKISGVIETEATKRELKKFEKGLYKSEDNEIMVEDYEKQRNIKNIEQNEGIK